jgi:hypothetical protein
MPHRQSPARLTNCVDPRPGVLAADRLQEIGGSTGATSTSRCPRQRLEPRSLHVMPRHISGATGEIQG